MPPTRGVFVCTFLAVFAWGLVLLETTGLLAFFAISFCFCFSLYALGTKTPQILTKLPGKRLRDKFAKVRNCYLKCPVDLNGSPRDEGRKATEQRMTQGKDKGNQIILFLTWDKYNNGTSWLCKAIQRKPLMTALLEPRFP